MVVKKKEKMEVKKMRKWRSRKKGKWRSRKKRKFSRKRKKWRSRKTEMTKYLQLQSSCIIYRIFLKLTLKYRMIIIKDLIKCLLYKRLLQGMKHHGLYIIFLCMLKIPNLYLKSNLEDVVVF